MSSPKLPRLRRAESTESSGTQRSTSSSKLLFGEIPSPTESVTSRRSFRTQTSICNLVLCTSQAFLRFWQSEPCRNSLLSYLDTDELANLRLVCHDFSSRAAPLLFKSLSVTFTSGSFTKPSRMAALERIGEHVKTFAFNLPHSPGTFLPPLIDDFTGEERKLVYQPQIHKPSSLAGKVKEPKYGSWDMTDLLIRQYPPLFHAATNVPSFIEAFEALPNLSHLKVSCPGQEPSQRYRRSTVDYALISLRIAIERAPLYCLDTLSMLPIHPSGLLYLQPMHGYGATPLSAKRWGQIRKLAIHMDSFPVTHIYRFEHLKILHTYLRTFSPKLTRFFFRWRGMKGPCPVTLESEPCLQAASTPHPSGQRHTPRPLRFHRLRQIELENMAVDACQLSTFISTHRRTLSEMNFEDIHLRHGDWDEALSPLSRIAGSDAWKRRQEEVMDVPLILSPVGIEPIVVDMAIQEQKAERGSITLSRWLSRTRGVAAKGKAREGWWGSDGHMKRFLRGSVLPWR